MSRVVGEAEVREVTIGDIGVITVLGLLVLLVITATVIFSVTALDNWLDGIISRKIKKMLGE